MVPQMMSLSDHVPVLPEVFLLLAGMALLMYGVFHGEESAAGTCWLAIGALAVTALLISAQGSAAVTLFNGSVVVDPFARFMKLLTVVGSGFAILMSFDYMREARMLRFEFPVLVLLATAGMMLMISANDLISLYLALELQSLALYVIAAIRRDSLWSSEAGLKYFVLGALSSGLLLYGASLVYGFTGVTTFPAIAEALEGAPRSLGLIFGLVFILAGLAFKVSAVPFHMWTPDVYQGAPTPVTAFFAAAPKVAAVALLVRVMLDGFLPVFGDWQQIVIAISLASMALGSFAAIGQRNIKRLMAYSSIGHVGFALVGLATGTEQGVRGVIIYMAIYLAMTLGTFAFILAMRRSEGMVEDIDELSGLSRSRPFAAFFLAMLLFSLAGIPPLAGFFAKFYVFLAAIQAGLYWLAVAGVVLSVVGAYYYLRIIKIMYFDEPAEPFHEMPGKLGLVFGLSGLFVLLFFVDPAPLVTAAGQAAKSLF